MAISVNDGKSVIRRNLRNRNHWLLVSTEGVVSDRGGIEAQFRHPVRSSTL